MNFYVYLPVAGLATNVLVITAAGAAVGFLSGLVGVGGGFLITPLLMLLGIPPEVAIATGANQATATAVAGAAAHRQRRNVDSKMGALLVVSGLVGAFVGVRLVALLRQAGQFDLSIALCYVIMLGTVGALMLIESTATMRREATATGPRGVRRSQHSWVHGLPLKMRFPQSRLYISAIPPLVVGCFVGMLTALMGVGGGFILVPAMVYLLRMPTSVAIGTSLFQIVFVSAFTTVLQAVSIKSVDVLLGLLLIAGGVVGTQFGARASGRLRGEHLRALLALLVLGVCLRVAFDLVQRPDELFTLTSGSASRL